MIGPSWFNMNARSREALLLATVRPILARLEHGETLSTANLYAALTEGGEPLAPVQVTALYRGLTQLAKHHPYLADRSKAQAGVGILHGHSVRPWLWHRPVERAEVKRCPHCGGELP